jgi:hypothetical protein
MKIKTKTLIVVLHILSWLAFIGLAVKAGSYLISYIVSMGNPIASKDLYNGTDLSAYRQQSFWNYTMIAWYKILLYATQAYVALLLTRLLSIMNISRPFHANVAILLQRISFFMLVVWGIAMVHNIHLAILEKLYGISSAYIPGDFLFLAGIVYVFAQIFKRGVEIQSENELTV